MDGCLSCWRVCIADGNAILDRVRRITLFGIGWTACPPSFTPSSSWMKIRGIYGYGLARYQLLELGKGEGVGSWGRGGVAFSCFSAYVDLFSSPFWFFVLFS